LFTFVARVEQNFICPEALSLCPLGKYLRVDHISWHRYIMKKINLTFT